MASRTYGRTHPWIKFSADLRDAPPSLWILLGEARSKCEHLAGALLPPAVAQRLHRLYLVKGVQGTTAIEGNTLTLEQIDRHLRGELRLPPSQAYLQQEIDNILRACNEIASDDLHDRHPTITVDLVRSFNRTVLEGLELEQGVVPGEIRTYDVGVLRYRGAPAEDCEFLLERLCAWLNSTDFSADDDLGLAVPILKAVFAHLYLAWIHPFGDGNGRTARLLEFHILVHAGVPTPAAHLLSNHYNLTRTAYYRELDQASRSGGDVRSFLRYALQGCVDQLREQVTTVQAAQLMIAWRDFVNECFEGQKSPAASRRKHLAFALSLRPVALGSGDIFGLPELAAEYRDRTKKTLTRDLNELVEMDLVEQVEGDKYRGRPEIMFAFLPGRREQKERLREIIKMRLDPPVPR
jgi:Fic family protein